MTKENGETFVSFKWMLAQTLVIIMAVVGFAITIISSVNNKIDMGLNSKVSIILFEERTKSLAQSDSDLFKLVEQYSKDRNVTNDRLGLIEQHLAIIVGKPLIKSKESKSP